MTFPFGSILFHQEQMRTSLLLRTYLNCSSPVNRHGSTTGLTAAITSCSPRGDVRLVMGYLKAEGMREKEEPVVNSIIYQSIQKTHIIPSSHVNEIEWLYVQWSKSMSSVNYGWHAQVGCQMIKEFTVPFSSSIWIPLEGIPTPQCIRHTVRVFY